MPTAAEFWKFGIGFAWNAFFDSSSEAKAAAAALRADVLDTAVCSLKGFGVVRILRSNGLLFTSVDGALVVIDKRGGRFAAELKLGDFGTVNGFDWTFGIPLHRKVEATVGLITVFEPSPSRTRALLVDELKENGTGVVGTNFFFIKMIGFGGSTTLFGTGAVSLTSTRVRLNDELKLNGTGVVGTNFFFTAETIFADSFLRTGSSPKTLCDSCASGNIRVFLEAVRLNGTGVVGTNVDFLEVPVAAGFTVASTGLFTVVVGCRGGLVVELLS
mmetsp:Transcript_19850/g.30161  ORF Transcript_19850/g.30161 Transcript_19850/m.30161 type:complete len:273 (+) Transcript_19850:1884-2702(+)